MLLCSSAWASPPHTISCRSKAVQCTKYFCQYGALNIVLENCVERFSPIENIRKCIFFQLLHSEDLDHQETKLKFGPFWSQMKCLMTLTKNLAMSFPKVLKLFLQKSNKTCKMKDTLGSHWWLYSILSFVCWGWSRWHWTPSLVTCKNKFHHVNKWT